MNELIKNTLALIRVKHWVKNMAVFLPAFFAARADLLLSSELWILFISFCFAASSIYIFNDIIDVESDKQHPTKRNRPIASGFFSKRGAILLLTVMVSLFILSLIALNSSYLYVLGYFFMNLAYSFKLKEFSIIDVTCISLGFVLRILAGGAMVGVYVSHWMIIIVFLLSISLAFAKRRDDLVLVPSAEKEELRKALNGYSLEFLDIAKSIALSITLVSYIMYSTSPDVIQRMGSDKVYLTSLFVFLGIMRYLQITLVDKKSGSPMDVLWEDRFMQITILLWILLFVTILYGGNL